MSAESIGASHVGTECAGVDRLKEGSRLAGRRHEQSQDHERQSELQRDCVRFSRLLLWWLRDLGSTLDLSPVVEGIERHGAESAEMKRTIALEAPQLTLRQCRTLEHIVQLEQHLHRIAKLVTNLGQPEGADLGGDRSDSAAGELMVMLLRVDMLSLKMGMRQERNWFDRCLSVWGRQLDEAVSRYSIVQKPQLQLACTNKVWATVREVCRRIQIADELRAILNRNREAIAGRNQMNFAIHHLGGILICLK